MGLKAENCSLFRSWASILHRVLHVKSLEVPAPTFSLKAIYWVSAWFLEYATCTAGALYVPTKFVPMPFGLEGASLLVLKTVAKPLCAWLYLRQ